MVCPLRVWTSVAAAQLIIQPYPTDMQSMAGEILKILYDTDRNIMSISQFLQSQFNIHFQVSWLKKCFLTTEIIYK